MNEIEREKQRKYNKTWHANNKDKRRKYNQTTKKATKLYIIAVKEQAGCNICGFKHPAALQFHHRDPATKLFEVANAVREGYGRKKINDEIAKCDIICANCHLILHYDEKQTE